MPTTGLRVASVDDNPHDSRLLERRLRRVTREELLFSAFEDASAAIEAIPNADPDLIFVDYHIGEQTGFDVLEQLKARGVQAPIVLVTGGVDEETAARAVRVGFADYLLKSNIEKGTLAGTIELAKTLSEERAAARRTEELLVKQALEIEGFYHSISHELNTPLTSCREFTAIVLDEIAGPITDEQREYLQIVDEGQRRIASIVADLMDSTLLGANQIRIRPEECCVGDLMAKVLERCQAAAAEKNIELTLGVQGDLPAIQVDPVRWADAIVRLVDNAIMYSPAGTTVDLSVVERDDAIEFSVRDSGLGIASEQHGLAFDRLVQLSEDDPALSPGLGLGLFIAKEIASLHGGLISLDSELGKGSEFVLTLPLSPVQEQ